VAFVVTTIIPALAINPAYLMAMTSQFHSCYFIEEVIL
jgi:hypothetical protein